MNHSQTLAEIAAEIAVCERCPLHASRRQPVPGEGPAAAEVMFIGDGPGFYENEQGRPFVGAAGQFLSQLLAQAELRRSEVWIGHVVKCRPPGNRDPQPAELSACGAFLDRQVEAVNPSLVVTLGRCALGHFLPGARIGSIHGQLRQVGARYLVPMYPPADALKQSALKTLILADFVRLPDLLKEARAGLGRAVPRPKAQEIHNDHLKQLSLF
ncbi:MAG: uracil-DNA glycosylase [Chloroflexota bacterium]